MFSSEEEMKINCPTELGFNMYKRVDGPGRKAGLQEIEPDMEAHLQPSFPSITDVNLRLFQNVFSPIHPLHDGCSSPRRPL
jgi:hypothetical protein